MDYKTNYESWLSDDFFDQETKNELLAIKDDEKEIEDRFYRSLEFGTAGLRGVIGAGTNRMNIYTVSKATQGFANYLLKYKDEFAKESKDGIVIGYDSRFMSPEFAEITALVLNANGIKAYVFDELRPVALVSFAIRELNCMGGIVITASHNPPEYNGYKVYGDDGAQVPFPRDKEIIDFVEAVADFKEIKTMDKQDASAKGLFNEIGAEIDEKYDAKVLEQSFNKDESDFKIVYTPIHGSGNKPVRRILEKAGFKNVFVVKEQELPDSNFSTVDYPNPEDPKAFELGLKLAKELSADVILGTDPDADRVGAIVKNKDGEYQILTGNMMGVLIQDYILSQRKESGILSSNDAIISTVVSTNMAQVIAEDYGVYYENVLTGFKFIGEKILGFENSTGDASKNFVFGFEESYGCLAGTYARDKDAIVATLLICEMANLYNKQGMTIPEKLDSLYEKYGYYKEDIKSITLKGIEGLKNIDRIMNDLRAETPTIIDGVKVKTLTDYKTGEVKDLLTGDLSKTSLPASNVLYFELEDGSWFCVRPSGTEPKIKIYFGIKGTSHDDANSKMQKIMAGVMSNIKVD
ncbi:MAG: phospho-sugar mutase [bacterium]